MLESFLGVSPPWGSLRPGSPVTGSFKADDLPQSHHLSHPCQTWSSLSIDLISNQFLIPRWSKSSPLCFSHWAQQQSVDRAAPCVIPWLKVINTRQLGKRNQNSKYYATNREFPFFLLVFPGLDSKAAQTQNCALGGRQQAFQKKTSIFGPRNRKGSP